MDEKALNDILKKLNQDHIIKSCKSAEEADKKALINYLLQIDVPKVYSMYLEALARRKREINNLFIKPLDEGEFDSIDSCSEITKKKYWDIGLQAISKNEVCAMLIENESTPSGMSGKFKPGLPSGKCLFQLHAEKIIRLQTLAKEKFKNDCLILWYIMVDGDNIDDMVNYFKSKDYFGLSAKTVRFFEQLMLPCFNHQGNIVLSSKCSVLKQPDGSGGLFYAIKNGKLLEDMKKKNIKYVLAYSLDNLLVRIADPVFIGYCSEMSADCGAKMVRKQFAGEKVGTFFNLRDKHGILSIADISPELLYLKNAQGSLVYFGADISSYFMRISFLEKIVDSYLPLLETSSVSVKITHKNKKDDNVTTNCIVLKRNIYDMFLYADIFSIWEVPRVSEYCPIPKAELNRRQKSKLLEQVYKLHVIYVEKAGGLVSGDVVEISPLLSYEGENLEEMCKAKNFRSPVVLISDSEYKK